jgi:hypothetical protein
MGVPSAEILHIFTTQKPIGFTYVFARMSELVLHKGHA